MQRKQTNVRIISLFTIHSPHCTKPFILISCQPIRKTKLKGTVRVFSSDPLCTDCNPWFTTEPLSDLSDQ